MNNIYFLAYVAWQY